jgi:DNA-binding transcriptional MerR regulator
MFTIGQFSKITGLSIKTIRLYHERGLLNPVEVDPATSYRYFNEHNVERARAIGHLREMQFSLAEVREILDSFSDDSELVPFLRRQKDAVGKRIADLKRVASSIDSLLASEEEALQITQGSTNRIVKKVVEDQKVASIRWNGAYKDTGRVLGQLARQIGSHIRGKPFNLYYETEYQDDGAEIESGFPVSENAVSSSVQIRILPGGLCLSLVHVGPYSELGRSYARLFQYIQTNGLKTRPPIREHYLKGPSLIFRGNPRKYLTEIQVTLDEPTEDHNGNSDKRED